MKDLLIMYACDIVINNVCMMILLLLHVACESVSCCALIACLKLTVCMY